MIYKKMIHKIKFWFITGLLPLVLIMLSSNSFLSCQYNGKSTVDIKQFIKLENITKRITLAKLGYDAIIAVGTGNGIVVVDAGISHSLTTKYREIIEKKLKRNDFAYLINTHSHWDHTGGNQVFSDAIIVGHKNCINEMTEYWKDKEKVKSGVKKIIGEYESRLKNIDPDMDDSLEIYLQKIKYECVDNDLHNNRIVTAPNITFTDTMKVSMVDVTFDLIYFGEAHSGSDILIHIPEENVLLIGDIFSKYGRPSISDLKKLDAERWISVKQWIEKRLQKIKKVISGHGEILMKEDLMSFIESFEKKIKGLK